MSKRLIQKKVCLLGDFAVGKTSLIRRFVEGQYDNAYLSTIGVNISRKTVSLSNYDLNLLIWDLAGGDDLGKMGNMYLRGAVAALIVIDLTRPDTINSFHYFTKQLKEVNPNASIVLIGNKIDLEQELAISNDELIQLSHDAGCEFICTSAKTDYQVELAFNKLAMSIEV